MIGIVIPTTNLSSGLDTAYHILDRVCDVAAKICVVVDGAGHCSSEAVTEVVKVVYVESLVGSYAARNLGVRSLCGTFSHYLFVDDGVFLEGNLSRLMARGIALSGRIRFIREPADTYEAWYSLNAFRQEYFLRRFGFLPTILLCVESSVYEAVNGFDEDLTSSGDVDFCHRIGKRVSLGICDEVTVLAGLRGKGAIDKKLRRQVFGQLCLLRKESGIYFYPKALARVAVNLAGLPGIAPKGFSGWLLNYKYCLKKAVMILRGIFCSSEKLQSLMMGANKNEVEG